MCRFSKSIEEHDRIRKLAENPLFLTFLYHVYKYNLELPRRRVELYRLSVNLMLDWDLETNRPTHIKVKDRDAKKEVLKKVAYFYHMSNRRELPEEILFAQLKTFLPNSLREKFTPKEFIQEIENSSGILRHRTAETFQFIHLTFQEYLTAEYVNDNRDVELPKLLANLHNPWWREVTLLLASTMGNGTPLVERILDYGLQVADESERFSCLFIAFNCLFEAEIHAEVRDKVLDAFVKLPYKQVLDVIQEIVGPFEVGNEELETLFVNILNSPHESVQAWELSFLNSYPEIAETSKRLPKRIKEVSSQALQKLPDELQTHLLGALSLERITDAIWNTLVKDQEITVFDYRQRLYTQCLQNELPVETHQKLLLCQSAQLIRLLIGGLSLQSIPADSDRKSKDGAIQSTRQEMRLEVDVPFFTPDGKNLPSSPTFTEDFAKIWQNAVPQFINALRPLILTLSPALDLTWETAHELDEARAQDWALDADLIQIRDNGLAGSRAWPWARTLARALNKARELTRNETLGKDLIHDADGTRDLALDRIRSRAFSEEELSRILPRARSLVMNHKFLPVWDLIQNLSSNPSLDLNLNLGLEQDLNAALDLIQVLDKARALSLERKVIELLLLAQELILAWAIIQAREIIRNGPKSIGFVQSFLETTASKNHENPWYIFMISQQINASVFAKPDDEPFFGLQRQWEQRSDNPDVALYQSTFFVNLATLFHTFGIKHDGTFFDEVFEKSIHPQSCFVLRVSYLLYQIITNQATETEQQEFWKSLQTSRSPIEQEWLELSGLSLLQEATDTQ